MHAWRSRSCALVGIALIAAILAGAAGAPAMAQGAGDEPGAAATTDYAQGMRLFHSGRYDEALPYFLTARDEALAHYGPTSSEYATALNNLAELYRLMARYDEAEPLFREALAIEEERLGPTDPGLARPLNNLALLHRALGRYDEAERDLKRSLAILEDAFGRGHPDVAGSLNNLARLYETMGLNERAEPLLERSLLVAEDTLGPTHPATQQIKSNLERVSAALAEAAAEEAEAPVAVAEADQEVQRVGPPAELLLPPDEAEGAPPDLPVERPAVASAEPQAPASPTLPEPAAGPVIITDPLSVAVEDGPVPEGGESASLPEADSGLPEPEPEMEMETARIDAEERLDEAPGAAEEPGDAAQSELAAETELALLVPYPEARPSGRRWAKLPAGRFAIHLASVRDPISATEEWERLREFLALPNDIAQLEPERIELVEQGVFYRVLGGPFASQAEARAACRAIQDKGDYCAVLGHGD
jgi:tetratricopeptide (TPR) repeat protein